MKNTILFLLLFIFCGNLAAQNLTITQGNKEKSFKAGSLFEIQLEHPESKQDACCDLIFLSGQIVEIAKDSITMSLAEYNTQLTTNGEKVRTIRFIEAADLSYKFASADMVNFRNFKSVAVKKKKKNRQNFGGVLFLTGATTGLVSLLVDKGEGRNKILLASAIQIGGSFTLFAIGSSRKYDFKEDEPVDNWKVRF